eukprot:CCRYP_002601-RA/>CCRYP_002601-RA protein AED:0.16 eAED:0.16 QI:1171/1/1/1/1/1/4/1309/1304
MNGNNATSLNNDSEDDSGTTNSVERKPKSSGKVNSPETYNKEIQSVSASLAKRQCLHELKEYFMSTQNSSEYARKKHGSKDHPSPPIVPFCLPCKNPVLTLPHHGLCPKHADFFNSGSYEILNLIVDGNRIGCEACVFHFENGRPNKHLQHIVGCERGNNKGAKKSGSNVVSASRTAIGGEHSKHSSLLTKDGRKLFSVSLEDAAAAGCSKCQRELATGKKSSKSHDDCCPRKLNSKRKNTSNDYTGFNRANSGENSQRSPALDNSSISLVGISLEVAAAAGCGKCQLELKTGTKTVSTHDDICPRKRGGDPSGVRDRANTANTNSIKPSLEVGASTGCRKCQIELATGIKDKRRHGINCPLGGKWSSHNHESNPNQCIQQKQTSSKIVDKHNALAHSDDDMNSCVEGRCKTSTPANNLMDKNPKPPKFDVGTVVFVESRTWTGVNKPGGVARVTKVHLPTRSFKDNHEDDEDNCTKYDVAYVVETRREKMVEERFISLHADYVSPSKDITVTPMDREVDSSDSEEERQCNRRGKKLPTNDFTLDGKRKHSSRDADAYSVSHDAENICISSAEKLDEDGNPLSDYELLRLRNIKRNEARLAKLGLLVPTKQKAKSNDKRKSQPSNDGQTEISLNGGKKPAVDADKTNMPHRQTKDNNRQSDGTLKRSSGSNDDIEKPKKKKKAEPEKQDCIKRSSSNPASKDSMQTTPQVDSLVLAAKSGCRKCTLEWQNEKIDPNSYHDQCCPRTNANHAEGQTQSLQKKAPHKNTAECPPPPPESHSRTTSKPTPGNISAMRSVSPSPALLASRVSQSLPAFIAEFTTQAAINADLPAPRGSKWLPCPNPWGKIGHEEGDVVIISPFQSENAHDLISTFHQSQHGFPPKRFASNPFEPSSPYHVTHISPARGGYSVLRMTRDRVGLIPWGFTVRNHEFGGACLVDSIEPSSPAEGAEDISGWKDGQCLGLKIHDMIISINGKTVGGMTEPEFQIELDVCGPELMLVVCRFGIVEQPHEMSDHGGNNHDDLAMDWNDIGAVASAVNKSVRFGEGKKQTRACEENVQKFHKSNRETEHILTSMQSIVSNKQLRDLHSTIDQSNDSSHIAVGVNRQVQVTRPLTMHNSEKNKSKNEMQKRNEGHNNANNSLSSPHTMGRESKKDESIIADKCSYDKKISCRRVGESYAVSRYRKQLEELSEESEGEHESSFGARKNNVASNPSTKVVGQTARNRSHEDDPRAEESEEDDDENPWLGCVCGKTHPHPIKVFWLQCETCDAWYNVAEECVGFDANFADSLDEWSCWNCSPPIPGLEK